MFVLQEDNVPSWARGLAGGLDTLSQTLNKQKKQQTLDKAFGQLDRSQPLAPQMTTLARTLLKSGMAPQEVASYINLLGPELNQISEQEKRAFEEKKSLAAQKFEKEKLYQRNQFDIERDVLNQQNQLFKQQIADTNAMKRSQFQQEAIDTRETNKLNAANQRNETTLKAAEERNKAALKAASERTEATIRGAEERNEATIKAAETRLDKKLQASANKPLNPKGSQSAYDKEREKNTAKFVSTALENGRQAREVLDELPAVEKAIREEGKSKGFFGRALNYLPGASLWYNKNEALIDGVSKTIVTDFTNMKGLKLTDQKLNWLRGVMFSPWKTMQANLESLGYIRRLLEIKAKYGDEVSKIEQEYRSKNEPIPSNIDSIVESRVHNLARECDNILTEAANNGVSVGVGSQLEEMPDAKGSKGMLIKDSNGKKYRSDGFKWVMVK